MAESQVRSPSDAKPDFDDANLKGKYFFSEHFNLEHLLWNPNYLGPTNIESGLRAHESVVETNWLIQKTVG